MDIHQRSFDDRMHGIVRWRLFRLLSDSLLFSVKIQRTLQYRVVEKIGLCTLSTGRFVCDTRILYVLTKYVCVCMCLSVLC